MPLLCVGLAAVPHPAAFTVCQWIAVRPVQKSAEIVPLVKATHVNAITHAHRDALGQLEPEGLQHPPPPALQATVAHAGGGVHDPQDICDAILRAAK